MAGSDVRYTTLLIGTRPFRSQSGLFVTYETARSWESVECRGPPDLKSTYIWIRSWLREAVVVDTLEDGTTLFICPVEIFVLCEDIGRYGCHSIDGSGKERCASRLTTPFI